MYKCRFCSELLTNTLVDLHHSPPSNDYLKIDERTKSEKYFPLEVYVCSNCFLVQLPEHKSYEELFSNNYAYFSSFSSSWLNHAKRYVDHIIDELGLEAKKSKVLEIASNDGYLLQYFKERGFDPLGIEPTLSTAEVAISNGIETITEFFGEDLAKKVVIEKGEHDLIIGNNVLAHVPDLLDFTKGLKIALSSTGTITLEFPHLLRLIQGNQFDTIYHEHFSYFSLNTLTKVFGSIDLEVYHVEELSTHGGSLRIYVAHTGTKKLKNSVQSILMKEKEAQLDDLEGYNDFQAHCEKIKYDFLTFLLSRKKEGEKVVAYGAAAKGNTLLNYCGIKKDLIDYVVDANPNKQNKLLPGSQIPVVSEESIKKDKPAYIIIFPWNIKLEIMEQLSYIKDWGGKFVIAIPELAIIE